MISTLAEKPVNVINLSGQMVTVIPTNQFYGLSSDTKPTDAVVNGMCFIEMDTSKIYFYDAENEQWLEWGATAE